MNNFSYEQFFDKVFCINLDNRNDRWDKCLGEFDKLHMSHLVERVSAYKMSPPIAGCSRSHIECIRLAKQNNYSRVLILEDDITFHNEIFYDILINAHAQLSTIGVNYDILYFSANLYGNTNKLIDTNLAKITLAKAAHAYIISSSVYDFILDRYMSIDWSDHNNWYHGNPDRLNFDVWLKNIQQLGNTYGVYPSIAEQSEGHSDLLNSNCYYNLSSVYNKILENTI
jgi:GR25 family glycosyltransferase involved in LPS biosynthesis